MNPCTRFARSNTTGLTASRRSSISFRKVWSQRSRDGISECQSTMNCIECQPSLKLHTV